MEAVKRAKGRMRRFPRLLSLCVAEGNAYAMCVVSAHEGGGPRGTGVTKGHCEAEFQALKRCTSEAARKVGA